MFPNIKFEKPRFQFMRKVEKYILEPSSEYSLSAIEKEELIFAQFNNDDYSGQNSCSTILLKSPKILNNSGNYDSTFLSANIYFSGFSNSKAAHASGPLRLRLSLSKSIAHFLDEILVSVLPPNADEFDKLVDNFDLFFAELNPKNPQKITGKKLISNFNALAFSSEIDILLHSKENLTLDLPRIETQKTYLQMTSFIKKQNALQLQNDLEPSRKSRTAKAFLSSLSKASTLTRSKKSPASKIASGFPAVKTVEPTTVRVLDFNSKEYNLEIFPGVLVLSLLENVRKINEAENTIKYRHCSLYYKTPRNEYTRLRETDKISTEMDTLFLRQNPRSSQEIEVNIKFTLPLRQRAEYVMENEVSSSQISEKNSIFNWETKIFSRLKEESSLSAIGQSPTEETFDQTSLLHSEEAFSGEFSERIAFDSDTSLLRVLVKASKDFDNMKDEFLLQHEYSTSFEIYEMSEINPKYYKLCFQDDPKKAGIDLCKRLNDLENLSLEIVPKLFQDKINLHSKRQSINNNESSVHESFSESFQRKFDVWKFRRFSKKAIQFQLEIVIRDNRKTVYLTKIKNKKRSFYKKIDDIVSVNKKSGNQITLYYINGKKTFVCRENECEEILKALS